KSIFLQNVHSLLRTGGCAVIHLGLMSIEDKQGHSISLSDFFNQPRWQDEFYFDSNTSLLFVSKINTSPIDFCLSLNDKKSKYANPNPDPTQNKNVGWQSYYTWAQNEQ
ncbi:MAG: hypothetical protein KDD38_10160, partial [Bdellovibrionales bacterium]|nr:hypothetical protein [Bdellovibrionales bacterium]